MSTTKEPPTSGVRGALRLLALILVAAVLGFVGLAPDGGEPPPPTSTTPVVTKVDADADGERDDPLTLGAVAQDHLESVETGKSELTEPLREPVDPSRTDPGVLEGPLAAQEIDGCRTRFVGNYSSRNGVTPRVIVLHQTVSRERGLSSQNALTAMANRRSSGVSWHFLIGPTNGLCTFTVPLNMKAWTQGNANPFSIGIEVERYGDEPTYVQGAGERKLISVLRQLHDRFDIPLRRGLVVSCRVVRAGIVEHSELGACGGGHADVTPWSTGPVIAKAAAAENAGAAKRGKTCNQLRYHRAKFATQPRGKAGSTTRKEWNKRRVRINTLKARARAQGLDEGKCRA